MPDSLAERRDQRRTGGPSPTDAGDDTLDELRSLIVGPELEDVLAFRARLADPAARTRDVSSVLPAAIAQRANDPQLARALGPPVEEAITASVRRDPQPLADALFPAIGPAIRKAIAHTLASMMDYPTAVLLKTPGDTHFALAAITNMDRGNTHAAENGPCNVGAPTGNQAPCDIRQGFYGLQDVTNGTTNVMTGQNNVIEWQPAPRPRIACAIYSSRPS